MKLNDIGETRARINEGWWDSFKNKAKAGLSNAASAISNHLATPDDDDNGTTEPTPAHPVPKPKPAKDLTKPWISYLKNNQIVELKSDPNTGALTYKRPVTTDDVRTFLSTNTEYDEVEIEAALASVSGTTAGSNSDDEAPEASPRPSFGTPAPAPSAVKHTIPNTSKPLPTASSNSNGAYSQKNNNYSHTPAKRQRQLSNTPGAIAKRNARAKAKGAVKEDFSDSNGDTLSEKEVEQIFKALTTPQKGAAGAFGNMSKQLSNAPMAKPNTMANAPGKVHRASPNNRNTQVRESVSYILSEESKNIGNLN